MVENYKNQHIIPQFVQRYWSDDVNKTKKSNVNVIDFTNNSCIKDVRKIEKLMTSDYTYGRDSQYEKELGKIESKGAIHIKDMILSSVKYKESYKQLEPDMLQYLSSFCFRQPRYFSEINGHEFEMVVSNIFSGDWSEENMKNQTDLLVLRELKKVMFKLIESMDLKGILAVKSYSEWDSDIVDGFFDGSYEIVTTSHGMLLLTMNPISGFMPLSPKRLLIYGSEAISYYQYVFDALRSNPLIELLNGIGYSVNDLFSIILNKQSLVESSDIPDELKVVIYPGNIWDNELRYYIKLVKQSQRKMGDNK